MELTSISGTIPATGYLDIASYSLKNLESDTCYTLSMWVKGQSNADKIVTHLYPLAVVSGVTSQGNTTASSDGYIVSNISTEWKRIWITWKTRSNISGDKILLPARISNANGTIGNKVFICGFKLEKGNIATDWTSSQDDTLNEIGSKLTLTDNKISLASTTIELKGTTIAKSIEAEDLKVGSRTGASALEVLTDGTFYAKGSSGTNQSLVIDSGSQSIKITSPSSYNGMNFSDNSNSTIQLAPEVGGVRVSDDKGGLSSMSSLGIIANKAGVSPYSSAGGFDGHGALVGLGYGNVSKNYQGDNFIAGVIGVANNENVNPADAYGGWFSVLKANGLHLSVRQVSSSTQLRNTDSYITCYNSAEIIIDLPSKPYAGQVLYIRQVSTGGFTIRGFFNNLGYQIHTDGSLSDTVKNKGRGDTLVFIFDGKYWMFNYMGR